MPTSRKIQNRLYPRGFRESKASWKTFEFKAPVTFKRITDMTGGAPFDLEPGQWTDDTSMALCLTESLIEKRSFDPKDQMDRCRRWRDQGYLSSNGRCFDIGNTVQKALSTYPRTSNPFSGSESPSTAGNGSLMRLAPVPLFSAQTLNRPSIMLARVALGTWLRSLLNCIVSKYGLDTLILCTSTSF
jgi:ADP-ribosylglycohydrolase